MFIPILCQNWEFPIFVLKTLQKFGNFHVFFTLEPKKKGVFFLGGGEIPTENVGNWQGGGKNNSHVFYTLEPKQGVTFLGGGKYPKKNVGYFGGIPMSSLRDVHLISGIAHYQQLPNLNKPPFYFSSVTLYFQKGKDYIKVY